MHPKNILLITVDALRASDVGCIGGGNLTPNIDKLARKSILFKEAISNGPGTPQSFPPIFASVYPLMNEKIILSEKFVTLAQVLQANDFITAGYHSNPFLSKFFGWNRGFHTYRDLFHEKGSKVSSIINTIQNKMKFIGQSVNHVSKFLNNKHIRNIIRKTYFSQREKMHPYARGELLNKVVLNWFKEKYNKKDRFFLWMHYMDTHEPYFPPDEWLNIFSSREEASAINLQYFASKQLEKEYELVQKAKRLYDLEINYVDHCLGNLIKTLEDLNILEDTMIVLTADHGEAFYEHGENSHPGYILYDELIKVPLIIYMNQHDVIDDQIDLINLSPIIVNQLGIKSPKNFVGNNYYKQSNRGIISESAKFDFLSYKYDYNNSIMSYRTKKWKLISSNINEKKELYHLEKDKGEKEDVSAENPDIVKELSLYLREHIYRSKVARQGLPY